MAIHAHFGARCLGYRISNVLASFRELTFPVSTLNLEHSVMVVVSKTPILGKTCIDRLLPLQFNDPPTHTHTHTSSCADWPDAYTLCSKRRSTRSSKDVGECLPL